MSQNRMQTAQYHNFVVNACSVMTIKAILFYSILF